MNNEAELHRVAPLITRAVEDVIVQILRGDGTDEPFEVAAAAAIERALEEDRAGR